VIMLTPEKAQEIHEARQLWDDEHDPISCWCCCWSCDFEAEEIMDGVREVRGEL
jgi:hypothetical protein